MTSRHFYRHSLTGIVAPLNDDFAGVFGDSLTRVGDSDVPEDAVLDAPVPEPVAPETQDESDKAPADSDNKESN